MATTMSLDEAYRQTYAHVQAGRWRDAEMLCRAILQALPQEAEAYRLLGICACSQGQHAVAIGYLQQSLQLRPQNADCYDNLAVVYARSGQMVEAEQAARQAVALNPRSPEAINNLGIMLQKRKQFSEAEAAFRGAIQLRPEFPEAHYNLGTVFRDQQRWREAAEAFQAAIRLRPQYVDALLALGSAIHQAGRPAEAEPIYRHVLSLEPDHPDAECHLALVHQARGRLDEAVRGFQRALTLKSRFPNAHNNLGTTYLALGRFEDAAAEFLRALDQQPDYAEAAQNLATALKHQGKLDEAIQACHRALALRPDLAGAENNLGIALHARGQHAEALAAFRRALDLQPDFPGALTNVLMCQQFIPGVTLADLAREHGAWDRIHGLPLRTRWMPHPHTKDPCRRLKLGFVSADLGRHPVGYFLVRVLESLPACEFQIVCYSDRSVKDDLSLRIGACATLWRDTRHLPHSALADQIRADEIDILFDLAGHTAGNRLPVFARKPSPVQVTWMGYVGTTGLSAIDDILADRFEIPPGSEQHYVERVLRMPDDYICYDAPRNAPAVGPLPARHQGGVTFGCFNNFAKINAEVIGVWKEIVEGTPASRLMLRFRGLDEPATRDHTRQLFANAGFPIDRLVLAGGLPWLEFLGAYNEIDIALDTFPYSGGLTTCEALWMGVPVITLPGETFASRHSLSHLSNVGLTETIAATREDYVAKAVTLAHELDHLADLRQRLRPQMAESPLCDGPRFARHFAEQMRDIWQHWCRA